MKKWGKRLLLGGLALLALLAVVALIGLMLARGTPEWYQPVILTPQQREAAAQRATDKLVVVQNEAGRARSAEVSNRNSPTSRPADAIEISFSDDEINAFFDKWSDWQHLKRAYEQYITDPCILLQENRIILAGHVKQLGALASLHFEPKIDADGRLNLKLVKILVGKLPLPETLFAPYERQATDSITSRLPLWRQSAGIDPGGTANSSAIAAAMGQTLVDLLSHRSADSVLFLPLAERGSVPVQLTEVKTEDHNLKLVVQPMTAEQRAELLRRIRGSPRVASDVK